MKKSTCEHPNTSFLGDSLPCSRALQQCWSWHPLLTHHTRFDHPGTGTNNPQLHCAHYPTDWVAHNKYAEYKSQTFIITGNKMENWKRVLPHEHENQCCWTGISKSAGGSCLIVRQLRLLRGGFLHKGNPWKRRTSRSILTLGGTRKQRLTKAPRLPHWTRWITWFQLMNNAKERRWDATFDCTAGVLCGS